MDFGANFAKRFALMLHLYSFSLHHGCKRFQLSKSWSAGTAWAHCCKILGSLMTEILWISGSPVEEERSFVVYENARQT